MRRTAAILPSTEGETMNVADVCLLLGVLIAFATLILKVVEVARRER